jgi:hypothetical protein
VDRHLEGLPADHQPSASTSNQAVDEVLSHHDLLSAACAILTPQSSSSHELRDPPYLPSTPAQTSTELSSPNLAPHPLLALCRPPRSPTCSRASKPTLPKPLPPSKSFKNCPSKRPTEACATDSPPSDKRKARSGASGVPLISSSDPHLAERTACAPPQPRSASRVTSSLEACWEQPHCIQIPPLTSAR